MPAAAEEHALVSERFVTRGAEIGFPPPPVAVRLKLLVAEGSWALFAQPVVIVGVGGLAGWLEAFAPLRMAFGTRGVVRADFDPLPAPWASAFQGVSLDMVTLETDGQALVCASGARRALADFTRRVRGPDAPMDVRHVALVPVEARLLTPPQEEALRAAVEAGYYLIPRPLNLRGLAKRIGISSASLSERLRRAEGRVLGRYVEHGGRTPWDERTIFDARPSDREPVLWPRTEIVAVPLPRSPLP